MPHRSRTPSPERDVTERIPFRLKCILFRQPLLYRSNGIGKMIASSGKDRKGNGSTDDHSIASQASEPRGHDGKCHGSGECPYSRED